MRSVSDFPKYSDYLAKKLEDPEFAAEYAKATIETRFALELSRARESRGMSQAELAEITKIKQPMLSRYERGQMPEVPTLRKIAAALNARITIGADGALSVELI